MYQQPEFARLAAVIRLAARYPVREPIEFEDRPSIGGFRGGAAMGGVTGTRPAPAIGT